jgi:predicted GIY-YIG superfamily endonuclease
MNFLTLTLICSFLFFSCSSTKKTSKSGGTYYYQNKKTRSVEYVGTTNNFERRNMEHKRDNHYYTNDNHKYVKIPMPGASIEDRYQAEKDLISLLKPKANKVKGGNGPR